MSEQMDRTVDLFDLPLELRPIRIKREERERVDKEFKQLVCDLASKYSIRDLMIAAGYKSVSPVQSILKDKSDD